MKWFKHMSDSIDDPFIQDLLDEFGPHGYLMWFGLIEIISKESGHNVTGKVIISEVYLRRKLRGSTVKLKQFLEYCSTSSKLLYKYSDKNISINMPKMLEIKDNHTKNLQATNKLVSPEAEEDVEVDKEEEKKERERNPRSKPKLKKTISEKCIQEMKEKYPEDDISKNLEAFYNYLPNREKPYKNVDAGFRNCMLKGWYDFKKKAKGARKHTDLVE